MSNLSDALRTALEPLRRVMTQAARASQDVDLREPLTTAQVPATPTAQQKNRELRHGLYDQVKALVDGGMSQSDIARQLHISLRTVQRWIQAGVFPERTPRCYPHSVDSYADYLDKRLLQGCRNVSQLWRELRQQGYRGQLSNVWHWF
jgi:DNA-binding transcriptional regulator YiaG